MRNKNKRSQMEIMGLAIVVVLVIFAMITVMIFMANKKPNQYKKEFSQKELPTNILGTLMYTTTEDCSSVTFAELLQDCANYKPGTIDCGGGVKSCDYLRDNDGSAYGMDPNGKLESIFKKTLLQYKYNYTFVAYEDSPNSPIFNRIGYECKADKQSKLYTLPLRGGGTLSVQLDICT